MDKKLRELINKLLENRMRRAVALVLAIVVTFTTTYTLVLPAITLEKDTAETMSGVNLGGNEQDGDTSISKDGDDSDDNGLDDSNIETVAFDAEAKNENGETEALVHVETGSNTFPEGTTMEATVVTDQDVIDSITEATKGEVVAIRAVDLTFTDENGETVQASEGSQLNVTLSPGEGVSSSAQNEENASYSLNQTEESKGEEVFANHSTETTVVQYTEDKGAETVETNDDVTFQVEPENDLDQDNAVSFDMGEQSSEQESQTFAIVETVPDESVKGNDFTDFEDEVEPSISSDVITAEDEIVAETEEIPQEEDPDVGAAGAPIEEQEIPTEEPFVEYQEGVLTAEDESYIITMTYGPEALIPQDAHLKVEAILEAETYDTHLEETQKALNEAAQIDQTTADGIYAGPVIEEEESHFFSLQSLTDDSEEAGLSEAETAPAPEPEIVYARFFDITILDADENEVTPKAPVKVSIELLDAYQDEEVIQSADSAQVVHFGKDAPELVEAEMIEDAVAGVTFDTESFSVYGVVYTVDFHYGEYTWSITGGSAITLSELFEILKIDADPADVVNVEFSDPALVWVGKVEEATTVGGLKEAKGLEVEYSADLKEEQIAEISAQTVEAGDWALISVHPFTTEESLTVTMKNGEKIVVMVTDAQISTHVITADGEDYIITVTYGPEAGIPDGAELQARELLPGTDEYKEHFTMALAKLNESRKTNADEIEYDNIFESCPDAEAKLITLSDETVIPFARFFDIKIMVDGKEIEPNAPVEVSITYAETIEVKDGEEAEVIHFAEQGIELIELHSNSDEVPGSEIGKFVFLQDSFSVTGTMLRYTGAVAPGKYLIIVNSGGNFYALDANGGKTAVTRNSDKVTFANVPDNCQWTIAKVNDNGTYTLKNGNSNLVLYNGNVVGGWTQNVVITSSSNRDRVTLKNSGVSTYLGWSNNNFAATNNSGQEVYLARINTDIQRQGQAEVPVSETDLGDLAAWKNKITSSKIDADKTAHVYDFDKRIYEVDITASSNMHVISPSIDLELIVDTSRSMFFPATLDPVFNTLYNSPQGFKNVAQSGGLDTSKVYYFIGGGEQATVYALYYGKSSSNLNDDTDAAKWRYVDASYMNPPDGTIQNWDTWLSKMEGKNAEDFGINGEILNYPEEINGSYYGRLYTSPDGISRFAYLKEAIRIASEIVYEIDENARIGLVTFNANSSGKGFFGKNDNLMREVGNITLAGGTQQDQGLSAGQSMFARFPRANAQKIAILITDGAPNKTNWDNINTAATNLKDSGVTLYTLGLSLEMVGGNNAENLANLVTTGDNVERAYAAENGPQIATAVKGLIESLVCNADVESTITDTIDLAYYPVRSDGTPLNAGDYIALDGSYLPNKPESGTDYGQITFDGTSYGVIWTKQKVLYKEENDNSDGWHGTFFVKAKEDFLGGNTIKTNSDTDSDKILAEKLIITDPNTLTETTVELNTPDGDKRISIELDTPIVNVKELSLTGHELTWTLYLGSEVTEEEIKNQIHNLFDNIDVKEIINKNGTPVTQGNNDPVTFALKTLVGGSLTGQELTDLLDGKPVTRTYSHYDHENIGNITINLTKVIDDNGDIVYTLTSSYASKDPVVTDQDTGEIINWHNGSNGPGRPMIPITSDNTQTIKDYYLPQAFQVKKVDENGEPIDTSTAMFKLYRKAKPDIDHTNGVSLELYDETLVPDANGIGYFLIDTVHTDSSGIARIGALEDAQGNEKDKSLLLNASDGPYYLVETGAPIGYTRTKSPTVITVTAGPNQYTTINGETITLEDGQTVPDELYNLNQGVTITVTGPVSSGATIVDANGNKKELKDGNEDDRPYLLATDTNTTYQTSITNGSINDEGGISQTPVLNHKKQIDYLGDRAGNTDTTADDNPLSEENSNAINDLYRLYLDVALQKTVADANIVLIADYSYSMGEEMMGSETRSVALKEVLTKENGFISSVLTQDSGNQMTIIKLADAEATTVIQGWSSDADAAKNAVNGANPNTANPNHAINYEKALDLADAQIKALSADRTEKQTYVIFVSDGLPTGYLNKSNQEVGGYESMTNPPVGLLIYDVNGKEVIENLNVVLPNTIDAVGEFRRDHKNINICAIGIGSQMDSVINPGHAYADSLEEFQYPGQNYNFILNYIGRNGYQTVTTKDGLLDALKGDLQTTAITDLLIQDELSEYTSLYTNQPDFVVTKTSQSGTKTTMSVVYDETGRNYKVMNDTDEIGRLIINGKKIILDFKDDLAYEHGDVYTLSFNVEATTKAYEDFATNKAISGNNGYGDTKGDEGTDFSGNSTSSGKPGFYSNADAHVSYKTEGTTYTPVYDKPVIQVGETKLEIQKVWSPTEVPEDITEVKFKINRDGADYTTVTVTKDGSWKTTLDHLVPKKLTQITDDSETYDTTGQKLKKTVYVPFEYTLEEDLSELTGTILETMQSYDVSYEFTATETSDGFSFTNLTSKYEGGALVYYIPATGQKAASEKGIVVVTNTKDRQIILKKVGENNTDPTHTQINLGKAEFTIYEEVDGVAGNVAKVNNNELSGLTSNDTTGVFFEGELVYGTYLIRETKVPAGYNSLMGDIRLVVSKDSITVTPDFVSGNPTSVCDVEDDGITVHIVNVSGVALPSAGGPGTIPLNLFGILLIGLAGTGLMTRKKQR